MEVDLENRLLLGLVLSLGLALVGFVAGAAAAALWWIPEDAGLAGGAMALAYGLMGAAVGLLASTVLARILPLPALRRVALAALLVTVGAAAFLGYRGWRVNRDAPPASSDLAPSPYRSPYRVSLEVTEAGSLQPGLEFREATIEQVGGGAVVAWTTRDDGRPLRCDAPLLGQEALDLAESLRRFSAQAAGGFRGCTHDRAGGPVWYRVEWSVSERLSSAPEGNLDIEGRCFEEFAPVRELLARLAGIVARAETAATCVPDTRDLAALIFPDR